MTYSSEVLADSPLAYYRLGEASGSTLVDSSGNGRDGTYVVAPTLGVAGALTGDADTAADFQGPTTGGHATVTTGTWMDAAAITVEAWIKYDSTTANGYIADRDNNGSARDWRLFINNTTGRLDFTVWNSGGTAYTLNPTTALTINTTYHVVGTFDGTNIKLYVDGVQIGTAACTGNVRTTAQKICIGSFNESTSNRFNGVLDEVAYYGTALSAARVLAHYDAGTTAPVTPTLTLAGTAQAATAAFTVATVLAASLAGTVQPPTGSFDLSASAQVSLAGEVQPATGSFDVVSVADEINLSLAGTAQSATGAFVALAAADASLAGEVQPTVGAFDLSASAQVALAGEVQPATGVFDVEAISIADRTVSLAGTARRATSAITFVSQPAITLAGTARRATGVFAVDAQPTATLAGTVQPSVATFVTYVVAPVTPSPVVGAQAVVVARAFGPVTMQGSQAVYAVSSAYTPKARQRILIDNVDWSYFRGAITPDVSYTLLEPLLYGPATMDLPQVSACFERPGYGDLAPLRPGALVEVQRVLDDVVVGTDYKGVIVAFDTSGRNLSVELGGEASGRAALRNRQLPIFPRVNDLGRQFADSIRDLGLPFFPHYGPVTGIEAMTTGGTGHLEHIQNLCAKAWTRAGKHWTIMPDESTGAYEAHRKDDTTIHGTVFIDDAKTVANLRRDISEEPNRIYATGVTPAGQRVRFGVYPGLIQGPTPTFPGNMSLGSTGDGVRLLIGKLHAMGYLKLVETEGGYDQDVVDAVTDLQIDAGLFDEGFTGTAVPGEVNLVTWNALYDLGTTDNSLEWAHIEPAAQRRKVRLWNRAGTGGIMGVNPLYDPNHLVRDRNVDLGTGLNRSQMREFSRATLHDSDDANWVGDITFHAGALIRGDGFEGMTVTEADVMDARELRPGMNLDLPQFDGGTLFHIAAIQVDDSGIVTATVDTRFRDAMEVWEVIARNKESRNDPARTRNQKHRSSTIVKDTIGEWDEFAGFLAQDVDLVEGWNEFQVIAAKEGTAAKLRIVLETPAEFACMVFGGQVTAEWANAQLPRPLTNYGTKQLETKRDALDDRGLLYAAGTKDEPCGYWPNRKVETEFDAETDDEIDTITNTPTGKHVDDGGFAYRSANRTELTVLVWVAAENRIPLGRVLWAQQESGA